MTVRLPGFDYRRIPVEGVIINCAIHFVPEEPPALVIAALHDFLD